MIRSLPGLSLDGDHPHLPLLMPSSFCIRVGSNKTFCSVLFFKMSVWVYLCLICGIIFREKYCITFSELQERKGPPLHVLMCRLHIKGCLRGWQLCLFSAHIMPETFHVFISNFNETMQGGWKLFLLLMMKLKFQMRNPGYTAVYRDGDFSLVVWIYLPGHLPHITDLSAGAHPASPGFCPILSHCASCSLIPFPGLVFPPVSHMYFGTEP